MAMRKDCVIVALLALSIGCSGRAKPEDEPQTVQMKDHVEDNVPPPRERVEPPPPPAPEEELAVEIIDLTPGSPVTSEAGTVIELAADGPPWRVSFARGSQSFVARRDAAPLYVEGDAFGQTFVLSKFGEGVQVTLRTPEGSSPLTVDEAYSLATTQRSSQLGCSEGTERRVDEGNGTVRLDVVDPGGGIVCSIVVGRYTRGLVDL